MNRRKTEKASARATMVDVAKLAGVSQATVSMVLNETGGTRVTEKTRKLVREAADTLGYRVWMRSAIGSGGPQAIGFVID
ncbi:MAG: LacI family DNA-binding transcriptional regulator, partial [Devosia nanyangense]|nr:LacI family DNA-binding transcriptional regulator [Devosia nanyangense]